MPERVTSADFAPLINQQFQITAERMEPVTAVLIELTESGSEPSEDDITSRRAFSLIFHIAGDACLPQQIYHVSNQTPGELDIFLVPPGSDKKGMKVEAMFT